MYETGKHHLHTASTEQVYELARAQVCVWELMGGIDVARAMRGLVENSTIRCAQHFHVGDNDMESGGTSGTTSEVVPAPAAAPAQNSHTPEPTCVCVHNPRACSTNSCTMLDRGVPMSFGHATALVSHWRRWKGCSRCCASVEPPFRQVEGRAHALLRRALRHVAPRQRRVKDESGRRHKVGSAPFHVLAAAVCAKFEEQDVRTPADAENNYRAVDKALRAARSLEHARDIAASCAGGLVDFAAQVRAVLVREACTLLTLCRVRPRHRTAALCEPRRWTAAHAKCWRAWGWMCDMYTSYEAQMVRAVLFLLLLLRFGNA